MTLPFGDPTGGEAPTVGFALLLSALAGLSTGIGSAIGLLAKRTDKAFLGASLGFSGGVMIYVSFVELLPAAREEVCAGGQEAWVAIAAFFGGMILTSLIDRIVPGPENPHEAALVEERDTPHEAARLRRIGVVTAIVIAIHNFPEGIATFFSALSDARVGLAIAVAVALHNIPEGISVAVPIYYATGSRRKAFWYSFLSGVAEPVGALAAWLLLGPYLSPLTTGLTTAAVAGVMVFLAVDQLIPNAKRYEPGHGSVYGMIGGMAIMALTLLLL
jgi:ZIP family zinc transporter